MDLENTMSQVWMTLVKTCGQLSLVEQVNNPISSRKIPNVSLNWNTSYFQKKLVQLSTCFARDICVGIAYHPKSLSAMCHGYISHRAHTHKRHFDHFKIVSS